MATQLGFIRLTGTIGGITFYKKGKEYLAKTRRRSSREEIKANNSYAGTRKHIDEFTNCSRVGKQIREAISNIFDFTDKSCCQRLVKVLWQVVLADLAEKGERMVTSGLTTEKGSRLLESFAFNKNGYRLNDPKVSHTELSLSIPLNENVGEKNSERFVGFIFYYIKDANSPWKDNLIIKQVIATI